mmetsp:Transcript_1326/g.2973  ORF Transcript_1326/g.2973 Transcript_1326/m.2973 type:complete len:326 (+) Transcript_1326:1435-2412(+)
MLLHLPVPVVARGGADDQHRQLLLGVDLDRLQAVERQKRGAELVHQLLHGSVQRVVGHQVDVVRELGLVRHERLLPGFQRRRSPPGWFHLRNIFFNPLFPGSAAVVNIMAQSLRLLPWCGQGERRDSRFLRHAAAIVSHRPEVFGTHAQTPAAVVPQQVVAFVRDAWQSEVDLQRRQVVVAQLPQLHEGLVQLAVHLLQVRHREARGELLRALHDAPEQGVQGQVDEPRVQQRLAHDLAQQAEVRGGVMLVPGRVGRRWRRKEVVRGRVAKQRSQRRFLRRHAQLRGERRRLPGSVERQTRTFHLRGNQSARLHGRRRLSPQPRR